MGFKLLLEVVIRRETIFHETFFCKGEVVSTFSYIRLLKKKNQGSRPWSVSLPLPVKME